jgi:hypothetical protein
MGLGRGERLRISADESELFLRSFEGDFSRQFHDGEGRPREASTGGEGVYQYLGYTISKILAKSNTTMRSSIAWVFSHRAILCQIIHPRAECGEFLGISFTIGFWAERNETAALF